MGRIARRFHPVQGAWVVREVIRFPPRRPVRSYGSENGPWRRAMRRGCGLVRWLAGLVWGMGAGRVCCSLGGEGVGGRGCDGAGGQLLPYGKRRQPAGVGTPALQNGNDRAAGARGARNPLGGAVAGGMGCGGEAAAPPTQVGDPSADSGQACATRTATAVRPYERSWPTGWEPVPPRTGNGRGTTKSRRAQTGTAGWQEASSCRTERRRAAYDAGGGGGPFGWGRRGGMRRAGGPLGRSGCTCSGRTKRTVGRPAQDPSLRSG